MIGRASSQLCATELTEQEQELQESVRSFLGHHLPRGSFEPGLGMPGAVDQDFSGKLAEQGWLGMALPRRYGGHERSVVDRFIVVEELLRWGAPLGYHWFADRQSGPMIVQFGTEDQRERFIGPICRAETSFCIGLSEADAGSDLAAVRTRAVRAVGGWHVTGAKMWTTGAQHADWMMTLVRSGTSEDRHLGLTQMIVDLRHPGVSINPIRTLDGQSEFNEVVLDAVFIPDQQVLGKVGGAWAQVTSELVHERGGPDRWLSTYLLVEQFLRENAEVADPRCLEFLGDACARFWAIRNLSLALARSIDAGKLPVVEAALVKQLGTSFEQELIEEVRTLLPHLGTPPTSLLGHLVLRAILTGPSFTLRGGTSEILRTVIAKDLR